METISPGEDEILELNSQIRQHEEEMRAIDQWDRQEDKPDEQFIHVGEQRINRQGEPVNPLGGYTIKDKRRFDQDGNLKQVTGNWNHYDGHVLDFNGYNYDPDNSSVPRDEKQRQYQALEAAKKDLESRKNEIKRGPIQDTVLKYLVYKDLDLTTCEDDVKAWIQSACQSQIERVETGELTEGEKKYGAQLQALTEKYTEDSVNNLASELHDRLISLSNRLMPSDPNPYSSSKAWTYWDIAKQAYLFDNPSKSSPEYELGNPMENERIQQEIVDRHFGWEIYLNGHRKSDKSLNNEFFKYLWESSYGDEIKELINKDPKPTDPPDLSSADLARLGSLVRLALEEHEADNIDTSQEDIDQPEDDKLSQIRLASKDNPIQGIWATKDYDSPITIIGLYDEPAPDGRFYAIVLNETGGGESGLPVDEITLLDNPSSHPEKQNTQNNTLEDYRHIAEADTLETQSSYEQSLDKAMEVLKNTDGIVELRNGVPTVVIPDLHARRDFLMDVLNLATKQGNAWFELLKDGRINIVCLGDGMHSELEENWKPSAKYGEPEYDGQKADLMQNEMIKSLGVMKMVMELKAQFPNSFHYLRGNHDNVMGHYYKFKDATQNSSEVQQWLQNNFGNDFIKKYAEFENILPLLAKGEGFVLSHTSPPKILTREQISNRDPEASGIQPDGSPASSNGLTYTSNLTGEATIEALQGTLSAIQAEGYKWIIGHRPVKDDDHDGAYHSDFDGQLIQINRPDKEVIAFIDGQFDPDIDIFKI